MPLTRWLKQALRELDNEELNALAYFLEEISVGELAAENDLRMYGVKEPFNVISRLISKEYIEKGDGCYTLHPRLRQALLAESDGEEDLLSIGSRFASILRRLTTPWTLIYYKRR